MAMKTTGLAVRITRVCLNGAQRVAFGGTHTRRLMRETFKGCSVTESSLCSAAPSLISVGEFRSSVHQLRCVSTSSDGGGRGLDDQLAATMDVDVDVTYDDVEKLKKSPSVLLIDVREPHELTEYGEYEGAVNLPLGRLKEALQMTDQDAFERLYGFRRPNENEATLVFCCMAGVRSAKATAIAVQLGYTKTRNYKGGWHDYHKQVGLPLKRTVECEDAKRKTE